ncbi:MAG TPA: HEPN domain-containing protein [Candidatus Aenigmarchaeota archaeon]|nr:HEPN domain-containing protein [Candidatus Aenigmarchaeota archaeon]
MEGKSAGREEKGGEINKEDEEKGKVRRFPYNLAGVSQLKEAVMERKARTLGDFLTRREIRYVEMYTASILEKFKHYIKAVVIWGSSKTGIGKKKTSDIDVAVIVDDTDVRRMTRPELKERLFQHLLQRAYPISKRIHPQPYLLSEFLEYVREGNPVIYNVLKDGFVIYDTGFFLPLQRLLGMGNIKPSKECVDKHIAISLDLLDLAKSTLTEKLTYDLEQAVVSSAQAVLMELGYRPPAPREVAKFVEEILVKKEKLVDEEYAKIAKEVVELYKSVEHRERKEVSGKEFDEYFEKTNKFVKKMIELLEKLRKERGEQFMYEIAEKLRKEKEELEIRRDGLVKIEKGKKEIEEKAEKLIREGLGQR